MFAKLSVIIALVGCVVSSHLYEAPSNVSPLATSYGVPIPSTSYLQPPVYSSPSTTTNVQSVHYTKPSVKTVEYAVPVTTYQYVKKNVVTQEPTSAQITYQVPSVHHQTEQYYYIPLKDAKVFYVNKVNRGSVANTASSSLSYSDLSGLSSLSSVGLSSGLSYSSLGNSGLSVANLGISDLSYSNSGWGQNGYVW